MQEIKLKELIDKLNEFYSKNGDCYVRLESNIEFNRKSIQQEIDEYNEQDYYENPTFITDSEELLNQ